MEKEKTRQIHKVYQECRKVFEPSALLSDELSNIDDEAEKEFYVLLHDFFLQQKQREAIKRGVF